MGDPHFNSKIAFFELEDEDIEEDQELYEEQ